MYAMQDSKRGLTVRMYAMQGSKRRLTVRSRKLLCKVDYALAKRSKHSNNCEMPVVP